VGNSPCEFPGYEQKNKDKEKAAASCGRKGVVCKIAAKSLAHFQHSTALSKCNPLEARGPQPVLDF
jgi:hypothetical protein